MSECSAATRRQSVPRLVVIAGRSPGSFRILLFIFNMLDLCQRYAFRELDIISVWGVKQLLVQSLTLKGILSMERPEVKGSPFPGRASGFCEGNTRFRVKLLKYRTGCDFSFCGLYILRPHNVHSPMLCHFLSKSSALWDTTIWLLLVLTLYQSHSNYTLHTHNSDKVSIVIYHNQNNWHPLTTRPCDTCL